MHFVRAGQRGQEVLNSMYTTEDRRRWGRIGGRPKRHRYAGEKGNLEEGRHRGARPSICPFSPSKIITQA